MDKYFVNQSKNSISPKLKEFQEKLQNEKKEEEDKIYQQRSSLLNEFANDREHYIPFNKIGEFLC